MACFPKRCSRHLKPFGRLNRGFAEFGPAPVIATRCCSPPRIDTERLLFSPLSRRRVHLFRYWRRAFRPRLSLPSAVHCPSLQPTDLSRRSLKRIASRTVLKEASLRRLPQPSEAMSVRLLVVRSEVFNSGPTVVFYIPLPLMDFE